MEQIKLKSFFKQVKERWKATSPKFWKKIELWMIGIGSSAIAILTADKMFDLQSTYEINPIIFTISGYVIVFCFAMGLSAKLTKNNSNEDD